MEQHPDLERAYLLYKTSPYLAVQNVIDYYENNIFRLEGVNMRMREAVDIIGNATAFLDDTNLYRQTLTQWRQCKSNLLHDFVINGNVQQQAFGELIKNWATSEQNLRSLFK